MKTYNYLITACCLLCSLLPQKVKAQIFIEDFEVVDSVTFSGSSITPWSQTSQVQTSGTYSITTSVDSLGTKYMKTVSINTSGLTVALLKFNQICRVDFFDATAIEVSNDGGLVFSQLTASEFLTSNIDWWPFAGQANNFTSAITLDWDPGVPTTVATNTMWHSAEFNLTSFLPAPSLIIRFKLEDRNNNGSGGYPGWYIDDIELQQNYFALSGMWSNNYDTCSLPNNQIIHFQGTSFGYPGINSVSAHVYFGDGSDSTLILPIINNAFESTFSHLYATPGNFTINIVASLSNGETDSIIKSITVLGNPTCGSITGNIYNDINGNCVLDSGETPIHWIKVYLYDNSTVISTQFSDANGNYNFYNIPSGGNYSVGIDSALRVSLPSNYFVTCPAGGTYTVSTIPSGNYNFALNCNSGFNLTTDFYGVNYSNGYYYLHIGTFNHSCSVQNATTTVVLNQSATLISSWPVPQFINGDTMVWINTLSAYDYFQANLALAIDSTLTNTDTLCYTFKSEPVSGDTDPSDNIFTVCSPLGVPFDPNNKLVKPEGNISAGSKLTYMVNFQNTGTATAQNVYVLDTLDADVEISSIKFIGSSHPAHIYILPGNVLKVDFPNIMLPDSNANEALSHGFFSYSINAKPALQNGITIENRAHIYFDYNAPVTTNTTINTIQATVGVTEFTKSQMAIIYPNPFSNAFSISSIENIKTVYLRSITGEQLLERKINDKIAKINMQNLPAGIYPLSVETDKGIKIYKLVKL